MTPFLLLFCRDPHKKRTHTSYNNEDEVGGAIRDWLASNPGTSRSELFITTKVWPHLCGSDADIEWSLTDSLRKLGLDYVDCFLVHWPVAAERTADYQPRIGTDGKVCSHAPYCGNT